MFFSQRGVSDVPGKLVAGHIPGLAAARSYDDRDLDPLNAASAGIAAAATSGPLFSAPAASAGPPGGILASAELETLELGMSQRLPVSHAEGQNRSMLFTGYVVAAKKLQFYRHFWYGATYR